MTDSRFEETKGNFAPQLINDVLERLVESNANVVISGKTSTGKTQLLNSLADLATPHMLISETYNQEIAYRLYQAILNERSIMTTINVVSNRMAPKRFSGMCSFSSHHVPNDLAAQFRKHMDVGIHIDKKVIDSRVIRYMDEMAEFVPKSKKHPDGVNVIYTAHLDDQGHRSWRLGQPTHKMTQIMYKE